MPGLASMIEQWDGQAVVCQFDRQAQAWVFIALHDTTLGRPVGGTRMKVYQRPEDGLRDAMRLAEGMTHKWAVIDFPNGGGKAVLALSRPLEGEERVGLLERYAGLLRSLKGSFATGEDLGTTPEDMLVLARECDYVHGYEPDRGAVKDPGPVTAVGVFAGLKAAVRHQLGKPELEGVSVLVQGVGDVGAPLARFCAAAGARLLISDIEAPRAEALAAELKGEVVPADVGRDPLGLEGACDELRLHEIRRFEEHRVARLVQHGKTSASQHTRRPGYTAGASSTVRTR